MPSQASASGRFDVIVVGGGSAGCVLAARLSESSERRVCLIEAGPDYGHFREGRWPGDILDATVDAIESHDWGFPGGISSSRAKIMGGCSAHNGCGIVWPSPQDFEDWGEDGTPRWSFGAMLPFLRRAEQALRVRRSRGEDLGPWRRAMLEGADQLGYRTLADLNDPGADEGIGLVPLNAVGAVRWNTAFAYLDSARERPNLTILADTLVDRLGSRGGRVALVQARRNSRRLELAADRVVLAAGAYGSPAILLRSGVGPPNELEALGVRVESPAPGVGANLADHPTLDVPFVPNARLRRETVAHVSHEGPAAQCLLKAKSSRCGEPSWDLILGPWTAPIVGDDGEALPAGHAGILVTASRPRSRGAVRLRSRDPEVLPAISHEFLMDESGHDVGVLAEGVELAVRLGESKAMRRFARPRGGEPPSGDGFRVWAKANVLGNYHPCGTCKMGPAHDSDAVVDSSGRVHGFENLYIVDASILPEIPRANIHLTVVAVSERLAELLGTT